MTNSQALPADFDAWRSTLSDLPGANEDALTAVEEREPQLTKPPGSLGRLEEISAWLAAWQGNPRPATDNLGIVIFAGSHGVTAQGVSAFPAEVTAQMVGNFEAGGAAINQLAQTQGAALNVIGLDIDTPTADFSLGPAMTENECVTAMNTGVSAIDPTWDAVAIGEMGIGNTTAAAAICHALFGGDAEDWVGPGTGVAGDALSQKIRVVAESVARHRHAMTDGLETLRHLGGREIAALAGAIIGARLNRVPVVLDGYVTGAAAACLYSILPASLDHCVVGHVSAEPGHQRLLAKMQKEALLNLNMRLGEGSGAAVAFGLLKAATACHNGMATFGEAGVSDKD